MQTQFCFVLGTDLGVNQQHLELHEQGGCGPCARTVHCLSLCWALISLLWVSAQESLKHQLNDYVPITLARILESGLTLVLV